jgi:HEPN domain-containing protein
MQPRDELVSLWLDRADDDLRLAELAISANPPLGWGAAFHAQQAAEKLLKALLTHHAVEFEKSHDIDYLLEICARVEPRAGALRETASRLTEYAVESRYPLPRRDPSPQEAREAIETAHEVRALVRETLRRNP